MSEPDDPRARTLRWDGAWFSVVGGRLAGAPVHDPWRAIERGRRLAALVGVGHEIDLPDGSIVESAPEAARLLPVPWSAPTVDDQAAARAAAAAERAVALHRRAAELTAVHGVVSEQTVRAAELAARSAQRNAAAATARVADVCERSALAHERAAVLHERLAQLGVDTARHRSRAVLHWEAAHADWAASRARPWSDDGWLDDAE
jgi:hypothetical protein